MMKMYNPRTHYQIFFELLSLVNTSGESGVVLNRISGDMRLDLSNLKSYMNELVEQGLVRETAIDAVHAYSTKNFKKYVITKKGSEYYEKYK